MTVVGPEGKAVDTTGYSHPSSLEEEKEEEREGEEREPDWTDEVKTHLEEYPSSLPAETFLQVEGKEIAVVDRRRRRRRRRNTGSSWMPD